MKNIRQHLERYDLEEVSHIFSIVGVFAGVISLWFVYAALREQTKATRAANAQSLVEQTTPINFEVARDPELSKLWRKGLEDYEHLDEDEKYRYQTIWVILLNIHENAYFQRRQDLIDETMYSSWSRDLGNNRGYLSEVWPDIKQSYQPEFVAHIEQVLREAPSAPVTK